MALHPHGESEPVEAGGDLKVTDLGSEHRLIRDGVEQLAHGALVCPDCSMPVNLDRPVAVASELDCAYCEASAPARDFLVRDVYDTAANEVFLIARIG